MADCSPYDPAVRFRRADYRLEGRLKQLLFEGKLVKAVALTTFGPDECVRPTWPGYERFVGKPHAIVRSVGGMLGSR